MIPGGGHLSGGRIGCPDLDVGRGLRHDRAGQLQREAELAGLILSDLDQQPAVGCALVAHDVERHAGQARYIQREAAAAPLFRIRTV